MFSKRRSKNYDNPADGELQGNYTVVSDSNLSNDDISDVEKDLQQINVSCEEPTTLELRSKPSRQSLPLDVHSTKEKRMSLKKRLSFRLFDTKEKKKQQSVKEIQVQQVTKTLDNEVESTETSEELVCLRKSEEKDVVLKRDSSLLDEILAETGHLDFNISKP